MALKPPHLRPLCPMCGAYSPKSCDHEEDRSGFCPWVESGQYDRDCAMADDDQPLTPADREGGR